MSFQDGIFDEDTVSFFVNLESKNHQGGNALNPPYGPAIGTVLLIYPNNPGSLKTMYIGLNKDNYKLVELQRYYMDDTAGRAARALSLQGPDGPIPAVKMQYLPEVEYHRYFLRNDIKYPYVIKIRETELQTYFEQQEHPEKIIVRKIPSNEVENNGSNEDENNGRSRQPNPFHPSSSFFRPNSPPTPSPPTPSTNGEANNPFGPTRHLPNPVAERLTRVRGGKLRRTHHRRYRKHRRPTRRGRRSNRR